MRGALPWHQRILLTVALADMCALCFTNDLRYWMPWWLFRVLFASLVFASVLAAFNVWRLPR